MSYPDTNTELVNPEAKRSGRVATGIVLVVLAIVGGFIGLTWAIVFYLSQSQFPIAAIGSWNLLIGGFFLIAGMPMLIVGIVLLAGRPKRR